jgi:hypothetical protein
MSRRLHTVATTAKAAVVGCSIAIAIPSCSHPPAHIIPTQSPAAQITADSLIVGVDDVRRIAGVDTLAAASGSEIHQPRHKASTLPTPCQAVFDQQSAFDGTWKQFDSTTYSANIYKDLGANRIREIADVSQAIAVYPNDNAAHTAFNRLVTDLQACPPLHVPNYNYTIDTTDPSVIALHTEGWAVIYHVKSSMLANVAVLGVDAPERAARDTDRVISDRIR